MKPSPSLFLATVVAGALFTLVPGSGVHALGQNPNSNGQGPGSNNGIGDGQGGGRPEWAASVRHDTSRPLRDIAPLPGVSTRRDFEVKRGGPEGPGAPDTQVQSLVVAPLVAVSGAGFDGVGEGNAQFSYNVNHAPPDTVGEAGLTQFVQWVNPSFAIFDKATGNRVYGPAGGNTIWAGFGGDCETRNDGDPMVQYDQLADRWVMSQFSLGASYLQCVAVSKTSDATGQWHRYAFSYNHFPDYPKLAIWPDGYYMTFNMFGVAGQSFTGSRVCVYDRAKMLDGLPATQICALPSTSYHSFLASDLEGKTLPPAGSPNYVLARSFAGINVWKFKPNFATPASSTFTGPTAVPDVAGYTAPGVRVPQPGTTTQLDTLGDRLMYRLVYRNLGDREALLVNHSVVANGEIGVRWYEFNVSNTNVTVRQQSTYAPDDNQYRWMGSMAIDKIGNIALGFSIASGTQKPSIRFAGRETTDPLGTLSTDTDMHTGTGSQTGGLSRWGDYSSMTVDPVDDCTIWYTSEYLQTNGSFNWSTRVGSFKFSSCNATPPAPTFTFAAAPSSLSITQGQFATYNLTVTGQNGYTGSGAYTTSTLPTGVLVFFSPETYSGGSGASQLTVSTDATTPPGTYQLTITATDANTTPVQSANITLVVNAAATSGFTLSASPSTQPISPNGSAAFSAIVTAQGGYTGTGTFGVTGLPTGTEASFSPATYSGGSGNSILTVTAGATVTPGSYPLAISATGSDGASTQSTSVMLVVEPPPAPATFTLSVSPGSRVIKRGKSDSYTVTVTPVNGFNQAVSLSVDGVPLNTSASFSPTSINGSGTSTLTVTTLNPQSPKGTFTLTITATSGSLVRTATVQLKIQ